ncbi:hypothetical protein BRC63_06565 [Halobacteriales archaeon QH_10_70_21]|nr:MAG: hypothetical protein BRC63_06565 [Halobacteriales archaeon QH_10_70_21]
MRPGGVRAVVNPHAGSGDAATLFATLAGCFPDAEVDARITTGEADVPVAVREQAAWGDLVVVGGDGTLREVAAALVESEYEPPLFVVPAGRGNSMYRHLYGRRDWQRVARALADGIRNPSARGGPDREFAPDTGDVLRPRMYGRALPQRARRCRAVAVAARTARVPAVDCRCCGRRRPGGGFRGRRRRRTVRGRRPAGRRRWRPLPR